MGYFPAKLPFEATPEELADNLERGRVQWVDVRESAAFKKVEGGLLAGR